MDVDTIDNFVEQKNITKLDLLKMDVEGFEENIIFGAEKTIEKLRPNIVSEFCPKMIEERKLKPETIFNLLRQYYKNAYFIDRPKVNLIEIDNLENLYSLMNKKYNGIGDLFFTNTTFVDSGV